MSRFVQPTAIPPAPKHAVERGADMWPQHRGKQRRRQHRDNYQRRLAKRDCNR